MFGRRSEGPLIEEPADALLADEVARALHVDPRPRFLARVRAQVSAERMERRPWLAGWHVGVAGAAIALVLAVVLLWPADYRPETASRPAAPSAPVAASTGAGGVSEPAAIVAPDATMAERASLAPADRLEGERPARARAAPEVRSPVVQELPFMTVAVEPLRFPEVVIAPDERLALALLLSPSRRQEPDVTVPDLPDVTVPDLPDLETIEVRGVVVEPLAQLARLEGDLP